MATNVLGLHTFTASEPWDFNIVNDNSLKIDNGVKTAMQGRAAHNLLDNSDFRTPVNQRGATSYSGAVYGVDRWMMGHSAMAMQINSGYITVTNADSTWRSLLQRFSKGIITMGKTYTAALAFADGTILSGNAVIQDGIETRVDNMSMSGVGIFINCVNAGYDYLNISMAGGSSRNLVWAALYEGTYTADTLPAYVPKGYAAELAACLRYCKKLSAYGMYRASIINANTIEIMIPLSVPMRIKPSIASGTMQIWTTASGVVDGFTFSVSSSGYDYLRISAAKTGHGLTDAVLRIQTDTIFSSDL